MPGLTWWGAPKVIKFFTGMGHLCTKPLSNICLCSSLSQPYQESALADPDGVVAVGHEGVRLQFLAHPVYLIQGAAAIQIQIQIYEAVNFANSFCNKTVLVVLYLGAFTGPRENPPSLPPPQNLLLYIESNFLEYSIPLPPLSVRPSVTKNTARVPLDCC